MVLRSKRNFNGGGWSTARDRARGQTSRSRTQASGSGSPTGGQIHGGGGGQNRSNEIQEKIKRQQQQKEVQKQNQINANNRARTEKMRAAQAAQDNRSYEERQQGEKGIDIYGKTIKEVGGRKSTTTSAKDYYGDVQGTVDLAKRLRAAGKDQNDPSLTPEEKAALERLQFSQDEGVYGGVSGYESEVNKMKKAIVEGGAGYKEALAGLTRLSGGNEEVAKVSALGVDEYLKRKLKVSDLRNADPDKLNEILTGGTGLSPEFFKNFAGQTAGLDYGEDELGAYISGDAMGYDPGGQFSFRDIEETAGRMIDGKWVPNEDPDSLYNKYLNRGQNWYDPLSGLFDPPKQKYYGGGGGGGWSGWGSGGGGGGGGYGGYGMAGRQQPQQMANYYTPQANLQQAMVNVHTGGYKRGGIVSLLELR